MSYIDRLDWLGCIVESIEVNIILYYQMILSFTQEGDVVVYVLLLDTCTYIHTCMHQRCIWRESDNKCNIVDSTSNVVLWRNQLSSVVVLWRSQLSSVVVFWRHQLSSAVVW